MENVPNDGTWKPGSATLLFEPERPNRIAVSIKQAEEKFDNVNPLAYFPVHVHTMFAAWIKPGTMPIQVKDFDIGPTGPIDYEPHQFLPVFVIELKDSTTGNDWPTDARRDMFVDERFISDPLTGDLLETIIHPIVPDFVTGICKQPDRNEEPLPVLKRQPGLWPPIVGYHVIEPLGQGPPAWFGPETDPIHPRQMQVIMSPSQIRQGCDLSTLGGLRDYIKKGGWYESDQKRLFKGAGFLSEEEEQIKERIQNFRPYQP